MNYSYEQITQAGSRSVNEDSVGTMQHEECLMLALADGLGGHGKGEVASSLVVDDVMQQLIAQSGCEAASILHHCFLHCQNALLEKQQEMRCQGSMKTTLNLAVIKDNFLLCGHIGDSRTYHFRHNKVLWRSLDHSVPQMLVATGEIKEKNIRQHPDRNRLLRVLGVEWDMPRYELRDKPIALEKKDAILLCTDGFWEWITEKEMLKALKRAKNTAEWLEEMSAIVLKNAKGATMDNYSAIALCVE